MPTCPRCGGYVRMGETSCPHCGATEDFAAIAKLERATREKDAIAAAELADRLSREKAERQAEADAMAAAIAAGHKFIEETKCTCHACGNVWFYGKKDVQLNSAAAMQNAGKAMMCCTGCFPAAIIPDQKVVDLDKCPKCGSKAITKEQVTHDIAPE